MFSPIARKEWEIVPKDALAALRQIRMAHEKRKDITIRARLSHGYYFVTVEVSWHPGWATNNATLAEILTQWKACGAELGVDYVGWNPKGAN